ncbi:PH domain-containing protein [Streptomyces sp. NPDC090108]|uniref:PH domain-containing protein n=1 Tax=Streptomyces sp. NPDC090108 TaxID=3365947 RepID=UPI00381E5B83
MDRHVAASDEGGIEREYRKRRETQGRRLGLLIPLAVLGLRGLTHSGLPLRLAGGCALGAALLATARTALLLWRGRTLTGPDGISVRRALTGRTWAWADVYDIRVETVPDDRDHVRKQLTYLYDTRGRRFLLPQLDDWQLDDPPAEVARLRTAVARYRGTAWTPRPETEALIRRRAAHRKAWTWAFFGAAFTLIGVFLLLAVLTATSDHPPGFTTLLWVPLGVFVLIAALYHWRGESLAPPERPSAPGAGREGPRPGA